MEALEEEQVAKHPDLTELEEKDRMAFLEEAVLVV